MAEQQYDEEYVIEDLVQCMKDNLNTEIDNINAEKNAVSGDKRFIPNIPLDSYIFSALDKTTLNYKNFFIVYDLIDTPIINSQTGNAIETVLISFEVATFDENNKDRFNTLFKLLRYRRALKAVIKNNPDVFRGYAKALMTGLKPNVLPLAPNATIIKAGLDITALMTSN